MNEARAAAELARWLDAGPGEPAPEGLDPDVVAAVVALRPDRAPAPRVDMDELLRTLESGPLATPPSAEEIAAAARFRDWLDEPDAELDDDPEAVEAALALRPDLAPPARVRIEDILAEMDEEAELNTLPEATPEGVDLSTLEAANTVPGAPRRRAWMWVLPGAGALLMAALALLFVLPVADRATRGFPEPSPPATARVYESATSERIPEASPPPRPLALSDAAPPADAAPSRGRTASATPAQSGSGGFGALETRADAVSGDSWAANAVEEETTAVAMPKTEQAPAGAAVTDAPVSQTRESDGAAAADDELGKKNLEEAPPPPEPVATSGAIAEVESAEEGLAVATRGESRKATKTSATRSLAATAPATASATTSATTDRDREQLSTAEGMAAGGDKEAAMVLLKALLSSSDPAVVMQAALDLGRLQLAAGKKADALATVRKGLAAGREPADLRAQLAALKDQIAATPDP